MSFASILHDISSVLFPPRCLGCSEIIAPAEDRIFCDACAQKVHFITGSSCLICGTTFPDSPARSHLCGKCLEEKPYFSKARAVFLYEDIVLDAIHKFKYKSDIVTGEILASFMADVPFPDMDFADYDILVPVPLHIKRLRERGFNQSLILARIFGAKKNIPVDFSLLKRRKFTLTQTGSTGKERKQNVKGAFAAGNKEKIAGKNILLIDDVYTTGATANECAKTLTRAGARRVGVLTLARVIHG